VLIMEMERTLHSCMRCGYVGLARIIYIYIRFIYGIFGREITKYTAIYGVHIRFWPTLQHHEIECIVQAGNIIKFCQRYPWSCK